jgi:anti-sigma factor RsiW
MTIGTASMTCRELVELVTSYLEGALSLEDRLRFEAHIAGCDGCTAYLRQMRQTIRITGRLRVEDVSPEAEAALLQAFDRWKR